MTEVNFRKAVLDDLPTLYEFEQGIVEAERPFDDTLRPGRINYYDIKEMINTTGTDVIVGVCENQLVASAYVSIKKSKPYLKHEQHGYVGFMFVVPEYRGQGIVGKLIEEVKSAVRKRGVFELCLDVYNDNAPAIRAYEKAGFSKNLLNMRIEI